MSGRLSGMRAVTAAGVIGTFLGAGLLAAPAPAPAPAPTPASASTAEPDVAAATASPVASGLEEDIRDIRGPKLLLPAWILPAVIAGVAILVLAVYFFWRRRRNRRARILLPYEIALQRLEEIRTLMQPARAREFSTAVSDIVRSYIEQRFAIGVTRRTTEEFLRDLLEAANTPLARHQSLLGEFLQQCDLVKFAGIALNVQSMEALSQSARAFVLATAKPEEVSAVQEAHDALPTA
jgi:LPXTG-motif cell wall-anchored protein